MNFPDIDLLRMKTLSLIKSQTNQNILFMLCRNEGKAIPHPLSADDIFFQILVTDSDYFDWFLDVNDFVMVGICKHEPVQQLKYYLKVRVYLMTRLK